MRSSGWGHHQSCRLRHLSAVFAGVVLLIGLLNTNLLAVNLTIKWDPYMDSATTLKLFSNNIAGQRGMRTLASSIPIDATSWRVEIDIRPRHTIWFAMQAVNGDHRPVLLSDLTEWVPFIYRVPAPLIENQTFQVGLPSKVSVGTP